MISTLHPGNGCMTPYGLCKVVKPITWTRGGREIVFGYWVLPRFGDKRQVHVSEIEYAPSTADLDWAAAKVRAVVENKVMP